MGIQDYIEIAKGDLTKVETSMLREAVYAIQDEAFKMNHVIHASMADSKDQEGMFNLLDRVITELNSRVTIKNLTPDSITFVDDDGNTIKTIEPSGVVTHVSGETRRGKWNFAGIPTSHTDYGDVVDLPAPEEDMLYIVSPMVAANIANNYDGDSKNGIFIPTEPVRDSTGRLIGYKSLGWI